jgi:hypothetical protein
MANMQKAAEELKKQNLAEALKFIDPADLQAALDKAKTQKKVARGLLERVDGNVKVLERALKADKVIREVTYNLCLVDAEYNALVENLENLELELKRTEAPPSSVVIGELRPASEIMEDMRKAKLVLEQAKNVVSEGIALAFKFDSYSQMREVINLNKSNSK